jgi:hypothetical protein
MTYSGKKFNLLEPSYKDVLLADIAHALAQNCRYTGHTKFFYSVAQHCILGTVKMEEDGMSSKLQLYFMLHDATETWYNDIARPLKPLLSNYKEMEERAETEVWKAFNLPAPTEEEWKIVKYYDDLMLCNEIPKLMNCPEEFGLELRDDGIDIEEMKIGDVESLFITIVIGLLIDVAMEGGLINNETQASNYQRPKWQRQDEHIALNYAKRNR